MPKEFLLFESKENEYLQWQKPRVLLYRDVALDLEVNEHLLSKYGQKRGKEKPRFRRFFNDGSSC